MDTTIGDERRAAELRARALIDRQLEAAGWAVQDVANRNLYAVQGVVVREAVMAKGHGRADYLLYVDQRAVGVIKAKPVGTPLTGVESQSAMYASGLAPEIRLKALTTGGRLPFVFEASGSETHLTNGYDPAPRARRIFSFPRPATLARTIAMPKPTRMPRPGEPRCASCPISFRPAFVRRRSRPSTGSSAAWSSSVQPVPGPDGHRRGQDVRRRDAVLPTPSVRRIPPHPVPGRPQQPRRSDAG